MLCLIALITSRRTVINQQQSAFSRPWTLCQSGSGRGLWPCHFAQIGRLPVDIPTLPACLPLSSEIARAWAACACACARAREHKGIVCCAWRRRLFRNNRRCHPSQRRTPDLATPSVHQPTLDRSDRTTGFAPACAVGRTNHHQQRALDQPLRSCLSPIQLSSCSGERRDRDPGLQIPQLITNPRL